MEGGKEEREGRREGGKGRKYNATSARISNSDAGGGGGGCGGGGGLGGHERVWALMSGRGKGRSRGRKGKGEEEGKEGERGG